MKKVSSIYQQYKVTYTNKKGALISVWFRNEFEARELKCELKKEGIIALVEYIKIEFYEPKKTVRKIEL